MEGSLLQSLSVESFSYSWLVNLKPSSLESLENSINSNSFIDMDPTMPPSKRFFNNVGSSKHDYDDHFKFDFPVLSSQFSSSPYDDDDYDDDGLFVHADELFSNGYLMPIISHLPPSPTTNSSSNNAPKLPTSATTRRLCPNSLKRCKALLSKKVFQKYLSTRFRAHNHKSASADDVWRKSCDYDDYESSIYEAVLYCKESSNIGGM